MVALPLSAVPGFDPLNPPQPNTYGAPDEVEIGWVSDGKGGWEAPPPPPEPEPPPPPTPEQVQAQYTSAVQARLDGFAQQRGYDGILSACSYSVSEDPLFRAEGLAAVAARDATWRRCYEIMGAVLAGAMELPALDAFLLELPRLEW
jgi:hypothetical protein